MDILTPIMPIEYKGYDNIMIDIETLDTADTAVILSISAVEFCDKTGDTGAEIEIHVDPQSCIDSGGTMNWETVAWWLVQPADAIDKIINQSQRFHVLTALIHLNTYIQRCKEASQKDVYVWANAPRFDLSKIAFYLNRFKMALPWLFSKEMCVRSYSNRYPHIKQQVSFVGTKHNGIDDCKHQINYLVQTLNYLPSATEKTTTGQYGENVPQF